LMLLLTVSQAANLLIHLQVRRDSNAESPVLEFGPEDS